MPTDVARGKRPAEAEASASDSSGDLIQTFAQRFEKLAVSDDPASNKGAVPSAPARQQAAAAARAVPASVAQAPTTAMQFAQNALAWQPMQPPMQLAAGQPRAMPPAMQAPMQPALQQAMFCRGLSQMGSNHAAAGGLAAPGLGASTSAAVQLHPPAVQCAPHPQPPQPLAQAWQQQLPPQVKLAPLEPQPAAFAIHHLNVANASAHAPLAAPTNPHPLQSTAPHQPRSDGNNPNTSQGLF